MSKRAERRFNLDKKKKKAKGLYPHNDNPIKYANNLTPCSCEMCKNPRHSKLNKKKLTIQEIKAELKEKD